MGDSLKIIDRVKNLMSGSGRFFADYAPNGFNWYGYVPTSTTTPNGAQIDIVWDALNNGTVFACLDATSKAIAQLPISIYQWDEAEEKFIRPQGTINKNIANIALERLKNPNERQNTYTFIYNMVFVLRAWGNAFIGAPNRDGLVPRMTLLNPYRMRPITETMDGRTRLVRYDFIGESGYNAFAPSEMFQVRDVEIDGLTGESLILRNADKIRLLIQADNFALRTFANGARISGVYKSPMLNAFTDAKEKDNFLADLKRNFTLDPNNTNTQAGGIFVTGDKDADIIMTEMLSNPQTADLLAFRKQLITEIAASFGVPPSKVGSEANARFNNVVANNAGWYRDTLNPIVSNIEATLTDILIPADKRDVLKVKFDDEAYLKGDLLSQANFIQLLSNTGAFTIDEVRAHMNYAPLPDGKGKELISGKAPVKGQDGEPTNPAQSTDTQGKTS